MLQLKNRGLDGGSSNETNRTLKGCHYDTKRTEKNQFDDMWYFQRRESGGLSGNLVSTYSSELRTRVGFGLVDVLTVALGF